MMVQFTRAIQNSNDEPGRIAINPNAVAAIFESGQRANVVVIRLMDGRGFAVLGNYDDTYSILNAGQDAQLRPPYHNDDPQEIDPGSEVVDGAASLQGRSPVLEALEDESSGEDEPAEAEPAPAPRRRSHSRNRNVN